jgi:hypothetical protein
MYLLMDSESGVEEIGGDPLKGSGFESETPDPEFESGAHSAEEDLLR